MWKEKENYSVMAQMAKEVSRQKTHIKTMTIRELTMIYKPLKLKSDYKISNKKQELIEVHIV